MILDQDLQRKLERLAEMNTILQNGDDATFEKYVDEANSLRDEVLPRIEEPLNAIIRAGILSLMVEDRSVLKKKWSCVEFPVVDSYENGNLVLVAGRHSGGIPSLREDGHPNVGNDADFDTYAREVHRLALGQKGPYARWIKENGAAIEQRYAEYQKANAERDPERRGRPFRPA